MLQQRGRLELISFAQAGAYPPQNPSRPRRSSPRCLQLHRDVLQLETSTRLCKRRFSGRVRAAVFQPATERLEKPGRFNEPNSYRSRTAQRRHQSPSPDRRHYRHLSDPALRPVMSIHTIALRGDSVANFLINCATITRHPRGAQGYILGQVN